LIVGDFPVIKATKRHESRLLTIKLHLMKTKTLWGKVMLLLFLSTGLSFVTTAQEQFRLSNYVNPDYQWRKLDLDLSLGGSNSFYNQEVNGDDLFYHNKNNSNLFGSDFGLDYEAHKNSSRYQGYQFFSLSGFIDSRKIKDQDLANDQENTEKDNIQRLYFAAHTENRFYNAHKKFLEVDLDLSSSMVNGKSNQSPGVDEPPVLTDSKDHGYAIDASLPVLVGTGRIEEVQDARLAIYILDDLQNAGDLTRAADPAEIDAFARFITEVKNRRYYDVRIQKIDEITRIDSMLNVMGLKARSGASYYTILNDDWDFASGPVRRTGGRFSAGIAPKIQWSYYYSDRTYYDSTIAPPSKYYGSTSKNYSTSWGMDFLTAYTWEKPANLYWQHSVNATLAYSLNYEDLRIDNYLNDTLEYDFDRDLNSPALNLIAGYRLGYYPNSRTELTLDINTYLVYNWQNYDFGDWEGQDFNTIEAGYDIGFGCYYYISERLRLTVNISEIYSYNHYYLVDNTGDNNTSNNFNTSFGAGFLYKIF
jgi:hypothetical protein